MDEIYEIDSVVGEINFIRNEVGDLVFCTLESPILDHNISDLETDSDLELYIYENADVYTMDVVVQGIYVGSIDRGTLDELFEKVRAWDIDPEYNF